MSALVPLLVTLPLLLLAQLVLVAVAVYPQLSARAAGDEIRLRVEPLDPIDPFRGAYVTLGYPDLRRNSATGAGGGQGSMEDGGSGTVFITLRQDGNVWVADTFNGRFQIFSPDGTFVESWGTAGDDEGEFNFCEDPCSGATAAGGDVAFDADGNLFVSDLANHRVQKFDADRTFITEWGGLGDGDGQFIQPFYLGEGAVKVDDEVGE